MKKLFHWLGIERRTEYVDEYFTIANFRSSIYMSIVIIVLELWMLVSLCYRWFTGDDSRTIMWYFEHLVWYLVFLFTAIVMIRISVRYLKKRGNRRLGKLWGTIVMIFFSGIAVYFGISISYSDYIKGEQILCFAMMMIFVVGLLNWRPIVSIGFTGAIFLFFYIMMYRAPEVEMSYATEVNFFTFWISVVMLSLAVYHQRLAEAEKDERLEFRSVTDELTGIHNMHYFRETAAEAIKAIPDKEYILLFMDISNFKAYNEKHGFDEGNVLLRSVAGEISECFSNSIYARVSDDHFAVLTENAGAKEKIEKLQKYVAENHPNTRLKLKVGSYIPTDPNEDIAVACDHARYACSMIKKIYEKDYNEYDKKLDDEFRLKQYVVNHIDEAVEKGYIEVYYQPVVYAKDKSICNFEALARWNDPVYGLLNPGQFIAALEEYRLIHKLDRKVLEIVCRDINSHMGVMNKDVPVSVNFSRLDFELMDVADEMDILMTRYKVNKEYLYVEITESALADGEGVVRAATSLIKDKGIQLWLDDFGAGYSSLNMLKEFSFDVLKIDMAFLRNFNSNAKSKPIINSIVQMAELMGMRTLVEGVETSEQAQYLTSIGCEKLQGYFFGKPKPLSAYVQEEVL